MVWNAVVEEPQAVVFVSDRSGAALRRRERCLKLAGIPHGIARAEERTIVLMAMAPAPTGAGGGSGGSGGGAETNRR